MTCPLSDNHRALDSLQVPSNRFPEPASWYHNISMTAGWWHLSSHIYLCIPSQLQSVQAMSVHTSPVLLVFYGLSPPFTLLLSGVQSMPGLLPFSGVYYTQCPSITYNIYLQCTLYLLTQHTSQYMVTVLGIYNISCKVAMGIMKYSGESPEQDLRSHQSSYCHSNSRSITPQFWRQI